eukprot:751038-Hanusia_phi.AAC.1
MVNVGKGGLAARRVNTRYATRLFDAAGGKGARAIREAGTDEESGGSAKGKGMHRNVLLVFSI